MFESKEIMEAIENAKVIAESDFSAAHVAEREVANLKLAEALREVPCLGRALADAIQRDLITKRSSLEDVSEFDDPHYVEWWGGQLILEFEVSYPRFVDVIIDMKNGRWRFFVNYDDEEMDSPANWWSEWHQ